MGGIAGIPTELTVSYVAHRLWDTAGWNDKATRLFRIARVGALRAKSAARHLSGSGLSNLVYKFTRHARQQPTRPRKQYQHHRQLGVRPATMPKPTSFDESLVETAFFDPSISLDDPPAQIGGMLQRIQRVRPKNANGNQPPISLMNCLAASGAQCSNPGKRPAGVERRGAAQINVNAAHNRVSRPGGRAGRNSSPY